MDLTRTLCHSQVGNMRALWARGDSGLVDQFRARSSRPAALSCHAGEWQDSGI